MLANCLKHSARSTLEFIIIIIINIIAFVERREEITSAQMFAIDSNLFDGEHDRSFDERMSMEFHLSSHKKRKRFKFDLLFQKRRLVDGQIINMTIYRFNFLEALFHHQSSSYPLHLSTHISDFNERTNERERAKKIHFLSLPLSYRSDRLFMSLDWWACLHEKRCNNCRSF